jgi:phospholipid/cholesterol/gamma-HCH transport system permease protein
MARPACNFRDAGFTKVAVDRVMGLVISASFFLRSALGTVTLRDVLSGMFKTPFFGAIIALVGCHFGMATRGGTAGVGNSTTRTVVVISISILIADLLLTKLSILLWPAA